MTSSIVINGASFDQRVTGVQRVARELSCRLLREPGVRLVVPQRPVDFDAPSGRVQIRPAPKWIDRAGPYAWVNTTLGRSVRKGELLWSPTMRCPIRAPRHVPMIHDLSVLDHPEWFSSAVVWQWRAMISVVARRAVHITTISEFSRNRLAERLDIDIAKISVVPCGVDEKFVSADLEEAESVRDRLGLPPRYVLSVGSRDPRKNLQLLLAAWPAVRSSTGATLVIAGGTARTFASTLLDMPEDGVLQLGYVAQRDLAGLYAGASAFAFPSLYEGFGLPPLEGMAAGAPVVALRSTESVRDVIGDCGVLVDEHSPEAYAAGLLEAMDRTRHVETMIRAGRDRARTFTWDAAAQTLLKVLRQV